MIFPIGRNTNDPPNAIYGVAYTEQRLTDEHYSSGMMLCAEVIG